MYKKGPAKPAGPKAFERVTLFLHINRNTAGKPCTIGTVKAVAQLKGELMFTWSKRNRCFCLAFAKVQVC